jgi:hypothetical protein
VEEEGVKKWALAVQAKEITTTPYMHPSSPVLMKRKLKDGLMWPFFYAGAKQADAVSPSTLLMRSHAEKVMEDTLELLKDTLFVVLLGIPGVVSVFNLHSYYPL